MAVLCSLSESLYSWLSLPEQCQIWLCIRICMADRASAVQAAALKAVGTLAMCPSLQAYPGDNNPVARQKQRCAFETHEWNNMRSLHATCKVQAPPQSGRGLLLFALNLDLCTILSHGPHEDPLLQGYNMG